MDKQNIGYQIWNLLLIMRKHEDPKGPHLVPIGLGISFSPKKQQAKLQTRPGRQAKREAELSRLGGASGGLRHALVLLENFFGRRLDDVKCPKHGG